MANPLLNATQQGPYMSRHEWPVGPSLSVAWDQFTDTEKGYLLARFETKKRGLHNLPFMDSAEAYRILNVRYYKGPVCTSIMQKIRPHLTEEMITAPPSNRALYTPWNGGQQIKKTPWYMRPIKEVKKFRWP